jgi:branched-subunit amino acid transport protein
MDATTLWTAIIGAALGTFAMRISFLGPWSRGQFPAWLERALTYAPPLIFAALITPMIVKAGADIPAAQLWPRLIAVAVTFAWAWVRGGQVWPLVAGMVALHLAQRGLALI